MLNTLKMKKYFTLLIGSTFIITTTDGQIFTRITDGELVNTPSDSRSCNWVDINNDGFQDVFISNGKAGGENNMLYVNQGDGNFTTVTGDPIVMDNQPSDGATWADMDNDGDIDAFVVNWYGKNNMLYANNGDGTFEQIVDGIAVNDFGYSETAAWGDYDNDGYVDLYVTNSDSIKKNYLYHNNGSTFTKITEGDITTEAYVSRCANWIDVDGDNDVDMFVTNESNQQENLYLNNGDGTFTKKTSDPLVLNGGKTMSASWGDVDNDGDFDVFLANDGANNALFYNDGEGNFTKATTDIVSNDGGNSFGSNFADIDNDGDLDLFVTNSFWGTMWNNFLYLNNGDGTFTKNTTDVTATDLGWSYGNAFGDYDNDGDMDLVVANCYGAAQNNNLYNNNGNDNNWVTITCVGTMSNKSAIGAVVKVLATINGEPTWQMAQISGQTGYCGQNMLPAHFGLGDATIIDSVYIYWPSGYVDITTNLPINQFATIAEGTYGNAVASFVKNELKVVPNPADTFINLGVNELADIQIYNLNGQLVVQYIQYANEDLNITSIETGNYIVVINTISNFKMAGRLVVAR
jgi:enediyne biosynthesis protein E4